MLRLSVNTLRTSLAVLAFSLALMAHGADREKPASLVGLTKDQVFSRLGDPRSQMKAGVKEVMIFPKVKVTFRNGVVVETEEIFDDPPPNPAATAPAPTPSDAAAAQPPAPTTPPPDAAATAAKAAAAPGDAKPAPAPETNAPLEIKLVRPASANGSRPSTKSAPRVSPNPAVPVPAPPDATPAPAVISPPSNPPVARASVPVPAMVPPPTALVTVPPASGPADATSPATTIPAGSNEPMIAPGGTPDMKPTAKADTTEIDSDKGKEPPASPNKKAPPRRFFRRQFEQDNELPQVSLFTTQTYVFGLVLIGAVAYLIWRGRQRRLELDATTVSNTPFEETITQTAGAGAAFTADLLAKLEWKRFEELIAQYYLKTGVVAVRTKTGPSSPVHLKISWKGEAKPFACVQCHASPNGLIRVGPLQDLFAALTIDDIRRGYVVTNGKFNVEARDFAEEKHFTLLPGDLLLEKLNALPAVSRSELMHEITAGDYTTPTCPKCDVKMVRADDGNWRCAKCEAKIPAMIG